MFWIKYHSIVNIRSVVINVHLPVCACEFRASKRYTQTNTCIIIWNTYIQCVFLCAMCKSYTFI